ncbi:MAG: flagellar biosynthesis repressor FlbT [Pseudomonadota bacterium]
MSGLVLKLAPKERVLINGAVVENGDRRTRVSILTPNANILRLRDALHPDEAKTPVRRACYVAQLVLSGDVSEEDARPQILSGIEHLSQALRDSDSRRSLQDASESVLAGRYYQAMKALRLLIPREDRLLSQVHSDGN